MKTIILYLQFLLFIINFLNGTPGVEGASCTTSSTCQTTDYTLSSCSSNTCGCLNSSFVAIRSGCGLQLDKPLITTGIYSNQVILGQPFTLSCYTDGASTYEWKRGSTVLTSTANTHSETAASSSNVGSFTCQGKGVDSVFVSPVSDSLTLTLLGTGATTTSAIQPILVLDVTTPVLSGATVTLSCTNIPIGYTPADVKYKVNNVAIPGTGTHTTVTIDSTNAGKDAICELTTPSSVVTYTSPTSAAVKLPTLVTNIQSVSVTTSSGQTVTEVISYTSVPLTCSISPSAASVTYVWKKDGSVIDLATSPTYTATVSANYTCTAQISGQSVVPSSNQVKVTTSSSSLKSSSDIPVKGGRVILTCGDIRTDGTTYSWTKDSNGIVRQFDRRLQIDNVDTADNGIYACEAVGNQFYMISNSKTLTMQTTISKPFISSFGSFPCGDRFGEKGDYWLLCVTSSETIGMTYEWTVKGVVSTTVTNKYYSLPSITSLNNGDYTCKAKFGSVTSDSSATKTITVTKPGLLCYHDNVCIAAKTGYTGKCDTNDRCTCSDGYWQEGEICTNGVLAVMSSTFTMAAILLLTKLI
ncbi:carcinoembryonic antigen-related cell adhesion molecule 5-like isoform X1 [Biomphalaria glabrata]|uniref:Carcinoembryonic antigen-related cell adhesion molecule 5-like isoform X1 n=1 Tax=Biomphalaria glabrata TaxID=6526 RepID=A0A9W3BNZ7_BIOGL|nr:carcinoembryonic antigen-related cell adhesion molecule 5-like isoform X1 [Biomphalaria glabrata]